MKDMAIAIAWTFEFDNGYVYVHDDVLLFKEMDLFVAQMLNSDIAAQGSTLEECLNRLRTTLGAQMSINLEAGKSALANLPSAPKKYFERARKARFFTVKMSSDSAEPLN